jgi:pullulanase/glycogen debranching enzyme
MGMTCDLYYDSPLGAFPCPSGTLFRIFAPNARELSIRHGTQLGNSLPAREVAESLWEAQTNQNLDGTPYVIQSVPKNEFSISREDYSHILDPYALASLSARGPGISIDRSRLPQIIERHTLIPMEELVILEGHLSDLLGLCTDKFDRPTYEIFCRWLSNPRSYLDQLGINALELQPLQEFDSLADVEYHWGYMPVNYFAPTRAYATNKANGSQLFDFVAVVQACHKKGIQFILDVVYNHVGEPNNLRMLGGDYFFRTNADGTLTNFSGCGNDLRTEAPMARRLILDSLKYWVQTFGVDGFRFDLAELIDLETLKCIEKELRAIKKSIYLIAEPWSFRGHSALDLKPTTWSYWNDDFRNSIRNYVLDTGNRDALRYFLGGCTSHLTSAPIQSINYTASHDDCVWIDGITETYAQDGRYPRPNDLQRTRLMFAILFMSLGVPMLSEGQDFLRSKGGVSNTYKDGEKNRLSPERLEQFQQLHAYVVQWIRFRRSLAGKLLRQREAPSEGFFQFFPTADSESALGTLYNANASQESQRLLFLVNPDFHTVHFPLPDIPCGSFQLIADGHQFYNGNSLQRLSDPHSLGPLSCQLWTCNTDINALQ